MKIASMTLLVYEILDQHYIRWHDRDNDHKLKLEIESRCQLSFRLIADIIEVTEIRRDSQLNVGLLISFLFSLQSFNKLHFPSER